MKKDNVNIDGRNVKCFYIETEEDFKKLKEIEPSFKDNFNKDYEKERSMLKWVGIYTEVGNGEKEDITIWLEGTILSEVRDKIKEKKEEIFFLDQKLRTFSKDYSDYKNWVHDL